MMMMMAEVFGRGCSVCACREINEMVSEREGEPEGYYGVKSKSKVMINGGEKECARENASRRIGFRYIYAVL